MQRNSIKDTWQDLALKLTKDADPDTSRRTLNKYKGGHVEISENGLMGLLENLFGDDAKGDFVSFFAGLKPVVLVSNMYKELEKALNQDDVDFLLSK